MSNEQKKKMYTFNQSASEIRKKNTYKYEKQKSLQSQANKIFKLLIKIN